MDRVGVVSRKREDGRVKWTMNPKSMTTFGHLLA
jgi:hypothetical protein